MPLPRLFVVGDSISMQYGPHLERFVAGAFTYARKGGPEMEAVRRTGLMQDANGGDSAAVLAYLEAVAAAGAVSADVLLLNCGLHDIKTDPATGARQVPPAQYRAYLERIVPLGRRLARTLVWVRTTPADEAVHNRRPGIAFHRFAADVLAYNAAADAVMAAAGVPVVDLFTFTQRLGADLFCDHVHFHDAVREKQAAFLAGWLLGFVRSSAVLSPA
jgi:lysophospholipase L1-like esterase